MRGRICAAVVVTVAALGAAACTGTPSVVPLPSGPAPDATVAATKIRHVVVIMQENRSFDSYFGTLSGVRGFSDPDTPRLPNAVRSSTSPTR